MAAPSPISIGFLVGTTHFAWQDATTAFEAQLNRAPKNWRKGTNYNIEYQSAAGQQSLYTAIAKDFANTGRGKPINVIVTGGLGLPSPA